MRQRAKTKVNLWHCGHLSPVVVELEDGKKRARCLLCGECGPVCEDSEEALKALRDPARQRDEAYSGK